MVNSGLNHSVALRRQKKQGLIFSFCLQFQRTRLLGDTTFLWVGLRPEVGKVEGCSALCFDDASGE